MSRNSDQAVSMFNEGYNCAQSVLACCGRDMGISLQSAIRIGQAFGAGMCIGSTCGAVTGALMVIGLKHSKKYAADSESRNKAAALAEEFTRRFTARHGTVNCSKLLGVDMGTPQGRKQGHDCGIYKTLCPKFVRTAAEIVDDLISNEKETRK